MRDRCEDSLLLEKRLRRFETAYPLAAVTLADSDFLCTSIAEARRIDRRRSTAGRPGPDAQTRRAD